MTDLGSGRGIWDGGDGSGIWTRDLGSERGMRDLNVKPHLSILSPPRLGPSPLDAAGVRTHHIHTCRPLDAANVAGVKDELNAAVGDPGFGPRIRTWDPGMGSGHGILM